MGDFFAATVPLPATTVTTSTTSSTTLASTSPQIAAVMIPAGTSTNKSSLGNLGYYPNSITVVTGINNTITWTNNITVTHTVISLSVPSGTQPFTDENLDPGSSFLVTLTVPGTYKYHRTIHPWMMRTIVVLADSPSTTTTTSTTTSYVYSY
ncbi:MAG TPA: plastocyanin/azurin family copper-binding protein [Nitrososphaerales archaeon]|nr:plastocyanin/azurin family copper-binding protein [Nitrososphaerales archaeon]